MAGKKNTDYISAKESRRISKENRKITEKYEKMRNRKNVPREEYITKMKNPDNVVEFDNLHTYFFTDVGVVKSVDGVTFDVPQGKTVGVVGGIRMRKIRHQSFFDAAGSASPGADRGGKHPL